MKRKMNKNIINKEVSNISKFLTFFVVYFNLSSLTVNVRISAELYLLVSILIIILIYLVLFMSGRKVVFKSKSFIYYFASVCFIIINMLTTQDFNIMNVTIISLISISFLASQVITKEEFIYNYVRIIFFLSVFSLITMYVIYPYFGRISNLFPVRYNSTGLLVRDYIFSFHFEDHIVAMNRNTGIFREMGVYQHYLNLALLFHLFYEDKKNWLYILVFTISVLTTFSTPGIIFLFLILVSYVYDNKYRVIKTMKILSFGVISFTFLLRISQKFSQLFNSSISKLFGYSTSLEGRLSSNLNNLIMWSHAPIIGNGINKAIYDSGFDSGINFSEHITSTTTSFLAIYGIIFTIFYTVPIIKEFYKIKSLRLSRIMLIIGFLISVNTQRYIYDIFYYTLVFIIVSEKHKNFEENSNEINKISI